MLSNRMIRRKHPLLVAASCSLAVWGAVLLYAQTAGGQETAPSAPAERVPLTAAELEELIGPIALYPDDLVSIVLPASTYPVQIVQAARYLDEHENDNSLEPDEDWDDSVVALLNYPEVIELMNEDLDWTWELGEAALYQQGEVLDAIQDFRDRAYAAGNLQSDDRQVVTKTTETIVIQPADPKVIYVPYYEPRHMFVYQPYPVYHYYPRPYPTYYYPYTYDHSFGFGFFWGVTTAFSIGWHSHYLNVHYRHHAAHPYYGHSYYTPWYRRYPVSVSYGGNRWRPSYYSGARPQHSATVVRTNRTLGATSYGRGTVTTTRAPVTGSRSVSTTRTQPTFSTGRVTTTRGTGERTLDAASRARIASSLNRSTGTITRTRTSPLTTTTTPSSITPRSTIRTTTRSQGSRPTSTFATPRTSSQTTPARVRNQPSTTISRQRNQPAGRQTVSPQRSTATAPGVTRYGTTGGAAARTAPTFGGGATRSAPGPQPGAGGSAGTTSRSGVSANSRAGTSTSSARTRR